MSLGDSKLGKDAACESGSRRNLLRAGLACLAFYYPVFWFSQCLIFALPGVVRVGFGQRLNYLDVSFLRVTLVSAPRDFDPNPGARGSSHATPAETVVIVLAAAWLLMKLARGYRIVSGFAIAMLGQTALTPYFFRLFFHKETKPEVIFPFLLLFAVLCLGLRSMLASGMAAGYGLSAASVFAMFALPAVTLVVVLSFIEGFRFPLHSLFLLAPSAAAALLMSVRLRAGTVPPRRIVGWRSIVIGAAMSMILIASIWLGGQTLRETLRRSRQAANRTAMAGTPKIRADLPYPKVFFQKGVNFTAEFPDPYASEGARRMLEVLPTYGVNAVALVPYGWTSEKAPLVRVNERVESWESDEGLEELSRLAHARGVRVFLKPAVWDAIHLEYSSAEKRARWFLDYAVFLDHYARVATRIHADLFSVGGEFPKLTPYDAEWRKLIARTRELYPGPLVYAANFGDEFEHITFWDGLDYIGLQEYYPLPDDVATAETVRTIEAVQQKFNRPVIFTEAGFASHPAANRQPWDDSSSKVSLDDQARCYEAVFRAFYMKPWFQGMYWWKVGTNGFGGAQDSSHTPWGKPAMEIVKRWYQEPGR